MKPQIVVADRVFQKSGLYLAHANRFGGPTLRDAPWYRDINGIIIGLPNTLIWITFRRPMARWGKFKDIRKGTRS